MPSEAVGRPGTQRVAIGASAAAYVFDDASNGKNTAICHDPDQPCDHAGPDPVATTRAALVEAIGERRISVRECSYCGGSR